MPLAIALVAVPANNLTVLACTWFVDCVAVLVDRRVVDEEEEEEEVEEGPEPLELLDLEPAVEAWEELVDDAKDERVEGVGLGG